MAASAGRQPPGAAVLTQSPVPASAIPQEAEKRRSRFRRSSIGNGYGSECHLLRYLGRHRSWLNTAVMGAIPGASPVEWEDFHFDPACNWKDAERRALDFLDGSHPARVAWARLWPNSGTPINWDAVGSVQIEGRREWLLVEAKAHVGELRSDCGARDHGGRPLIQHMFDRVRTSLGVDPACDWLNGYYQQCNRIAVLHHLMEHGAPARLLWIYFTGDWNRQGSCDCPRDELGWRAALAEQAASVGLPEGHALSSRIHTLFLPVCPNT